MQNAVLWIKILLCFPCQFCVFLLLYLISLTCHLSLILQVSSYGGYLWYRLHTQTMRGDALPLPAEASRPDIILKVQSRYKQTRHKSLNPRFPYCGNMQHLIICQSLDKHTQTIIQKQLLFPIRASLLWFHCKHVSSVCFCPAGEPDDPGVHGERVLLAWTASPRNSSYGGGKATFTHWNCTSTENHVRCWCVTHADQFQHVLFSHFSKYCCLDVWNLWPGANPLFL